MSLGGMGCGQENVTSNGWVRGQALTHPELFEVTFAHPLKKSQCFSMDSNCFFRDVNFTAQL